MFKLSSEASLDGAITVENKFIVEYLPYADGDYVKVYLYGLSLAARKGDRDDSIERLARRLDMDTSTVDAAIDYWCDRGLMTRLGDEISYLSLRNTRPKIKKYDVDKFREFNRQAQLFISSRQITPNEFNDYYSLMERFNFEWQAMVLVVNYCVRIKGDSVSAPYILAVARNLAEDGYRSADEVGERLDEYGVYYNELCAVLAAMGGKRPDLEGVQLYKKWKIVFKFDQEVILGVAQTIKRGGISALDSKLTQYNSLGFTTLDRIEAYETERKELYKLAKSVNKSLGVYYDNVDPEIVTYIRPWLDLGFDGAAIIAAADYCMKRDIRRLSDLDAVLREFFSTGSLTEEAIRGRVDRERRFDDQIEALFKKIGIIGAVKDMHRAYYANWLEKWSLPDELINYAASLAADKSNPFAYMNAALFAWHNAGVTTVEGAKLCAPDTKQTAPGGVVHEKYSAEDLNNMFTHIIVEGE